MAELKTGKLPATEDHRDLLFENYLDTAVLPPVPPGDFGHDGSVRRWAMLGNGPDPSVEPGFGGAGDCVFAGAAHEHMLWQHEGTGLHSSFTGKEVISDYSAVTGYVVGDDSTDQGTEVRVAMGYRRSTGILDHGHHRHKIDAYVRLKTGDLSHLYTAMYLFGAVGIGIQFPNSAMDQFNEGKPWDIVAGSQVEGGHYIPAVARKSGTIHIVSWAKVVPMTERFYMEYTDEAWIPLSKEHIHGTTTPEGFNMTQLKADLAALKS